MHVVAQVNHRGLGVKVETKCLRDSDLIPRQSFLSTIFSILINRVLKFMCVFACSLVADKANLSSELYAWPYPPGINCLMSYKMPYPS